MVSDIEQARLQFPAYRGSEPYVFVCYSREDARDIATELGLLRDLGANVYYDEGISPGLEWTQELADAIDGCTQLLFFATPASAASRYCRNEIQYALERGKPVVPIYLEPTALPGGLQLSLGSAQAIVKYDLNDQDYQRKLSEALGKPTSETRLRAKSGSLWTRAKKRSVVPGHLGSAVLLLVAISLLLLDWSGSSPSGPAIVAVIPFEGLPSTQAEPDLTNGFAIEITNQLGKIANLRVTARSAVLAELERGFPPIEVGRRLQATHVVEGSLRFMDDRVVADVQLVDTDAQMQVWADSFEEAADDFLSLQSSVAIAVAQALGVKVTDDERDRLEVPPTNDIEAYRLYSRFHFAGADPRDNRRAITLLEESIALDPTFTDAISWLALRKTWSCWTGDRESCYQVRPLAERAMALDPKSPMANWALGRAEIVEGKVGLGVQIMHRAYALAPSVVASDLSTFAGLIGDLEESLAAAIEGVRVNPNDPDERWAVAIALRRLGDHERTRRWLQRSLAELAEASDDSRKLRLVIALRWLDVVDGQLSLTSEEMRRARANPPNFPTAIAAWGSRLSVAREWDELRRLLEPVVSEQPTARAGLDDVPLSRSVSTLLAFALAQLGEREAASQLLDESLATTLRMREYQPEDPFYLLELAALYAVKGDIDMAVTWLDEAYVAGMREHGFLSLDPMFEALKGNSRFEAILTKMRKDAERKLANVEALGLFEQLESIGAKQRSGASAS